MRSTDYDAVIVGGSFAGLSAALYLARARRRICVLDTRRPRNRYSAHSHGLFGHDGHDPASMLDTMRAQVSAYPSVELREQAALDVSRDGARFAVRLADGKAVSGARLLLSYGIVDRLPTLAGIAERWGKSVIHCPYCHGYEFSEQRLGVLLMSAMSVHQAQLITEWGPTTLFLDGQAIERDALATLERRGVTIESKRVVGLAGDAPRLEYVELADGRSVPIDALYIGPRYHFSSDIGEQLGCATETGPLGPVLKVDQTKATTISGVYAAGDVTRMGHTITFACADGVAAALSIHHSLAFPEHV